MTGLTIRWSLVATSCLLSLTLSASLRANETAKLRAAKTRVENFLPLKVGDVVNRTLEGGKNHVYEIEVPASYFLQVVVYQAGIDLVLQISDSSGTQIAEVDRPTGSRGRETISIITAKQDKYILNVHSLESVAAKGDYHLSIGTFRAVAAEDSTWVDAEALVTQAEKQRANGGAQSIRDAITGFDKALTKWRIVGDQYEEAVALYGSGISCTVLSENQRGVEYLNLALPLFESSHDTPGQAITLTAMGWPYMYLGDYDKALNSFSKALLLHHGEKNVRGAAIAQYGIAWIHYLREEYHTALTDFLRSLEGRQAAKDLRGEGVTLVGIARVEARLARYPEALEHLNAALNILRGKDRYAEADALSNLGWVLIAVNRYPEALSNLSRALTMRREVGDRTGEITTLYGLGRVKRQLGQLEEAENAIQQSLELIESLRSEGFSHQLRLSYFASIQDYYEFQINLLMELDRLHPGEGYSAKALYSYERARARGLIDLLSEAQIDLRRGINPDLIVEEDRITKNLDYELLRWRRLQNKQAAEDALANVRKFSDELEVVESRIRKASPDYTAIVKPHPLNSSEIQSLLDSDTVLLEYSLGDQGSYLWAITAEQIRSYRLSSGPAIQNLAEQLYKDINTRKILKATDHHSVTQSRIREVDVRIDRTLKGLSDLLIAPAAECLNLKRVVIVPPVALQYVPFAALPLPNIPGSRTSKANASVRQLIDEHEITFLPSASTLAVLRRQNKSRHPSPKTVVAFGDPVYEASDGRLQLRTSASTIRAMVSTGELKNDKALTRLVASRWEAKQIVEMVKPLDGKLLLDFEASKQSALSTAIAEYRVVHFASHAVVDNDHPELSGIALTMIDEDGRPIDGFLSSYEIFRMKLPAELVVLSACRTGMGKELKGEGLLGLTRGFMYAGTQRVIVSLWDVDDKPTAELMVRFYRSMFVDKMSPAAALRSAQIDLAKDPRWHSPYYWAGFTLQGEWK
jgi:CHAT domain-containing protein/TPR repeat protein